MRREIRAAMFCLAAGLVGISATASAQDADLLRFFTNVCFRDDISTNPQPYERCVGEVGVAFLSGSDDLQDRFRQTGAYLNSVIQGSGVHFVFNKTPNLDNVLVYIGPPEQMEGPIAQMIPQLADLRHRRMTRYQDFHLQGRNALTLHLRVSPVFQLTGVLIYINPAAYTDDQLDRLILRSLVAALGPSGHSTVYPGSSFQDGYIHQGTGHVLDAFDEAALRFAMKDLPVGAKDEDLAHLLAGRSGPLLDALSAVKDSPSGAAAITPPPSPAAPAATP